MTTLDEKICDLEEEIAGYRVKLDAATTETREEIYANLITQSRKTLNILLQQQSQAQAGAGGQGQVSLAEIKALLVPFAAKLSSFAENPWDLSHRSTVALEITTSGRI